MNDCVKEELDEWRRIYPLYGRLPRQEAELLKLWMRRSAREVPCLDASVWLGFIGAETSDLATWEQIDRGVGYLLMESLDDRYRHRSPPRLAFVAPLLFRVAVDFPRAPPGNFLEHRRVWVPEHDRWALTLTYLKPGRLRSSIACASIAPEAWDLAAVCDGYRGWWSRFSKTQPSVTFGAMTLGGIVAPGLAWEWLRAHWPQAGLEQEDPT